MHKHLKIENIDTTKQIVDLVDWLVLRHASPDLFSPTMYIDLEGIKLCREGTLSIFTLLIDTGIPIRRVCVIDVHVLGELAFNTAGVKRTTLKDVLQDEKIPKVFFDVRNDSDALFAHFGIALQGVEDVQLMESATRATTRSRKFVSGLTKCVENNAPWLRGCTLAAWKQMKANGERLFKAEQGGSYEVFNQRPIPEEIISYCVGDVQCLPELWSRFGRGKANRWKALVDEETKKRVAISQRPDYQPHGPNRAMAPWSEDQKSDLGSVELCSSARLLRRRLFWSRRLVR